MTIGKVTALTAGFLGAFALGVAVGPSMINRDRTGTSTPVKTETASAAVQTPAPAPPVPPRIVAERKADARVKTHLASMSTTSPALHARLKPVLNRGTKMDLAADGFRDAEQFATVAHAARNTAIPFAVLKHRVLTDGQSLADAIAAAKPGVDGTREATRARHEARADLDAIAG
jgi:hypothetical protein